MRSAKVAACCIATAVIGACGEAAEAPHDATPRAEHGTASQRDSRPAVLLDLDVRMAEARRALDREFVVFASPRMLIEELGVPVRPPVIVGSRPSPVTMRSDAPNVVSVASNGSLVAHREGTTRVRSTTSDSVLGIDVRLARKTSNATSR